MKQSTPLFLIALVVSAGCVEKSRYLSEAEQRELKDLISTTAPRPQHPLNIQFEDKVRLLGYDFKQKFVRPGEPFKIVWYWKVEKKVGEGWLQFTHIADAKDVNRINVDAERVIRRLHPPPDWKAGEYIRDVQELTLPAEWNSPVIKLYLGLWNGPHRLHVVAGPNDGNNRALGVTIPVTVSESANTLIRLPAIKTSGAIKIDGKLNEPDWANAPPTTPLVDPLTGKEGAFRTTVRAMYDQTNLYFAFDVNDTLLKSVFKKNDDHLWEQDAVEIMIDPDGDGKNYYEIQVSPLGVVFDTRYDLPRQPAPWGHLDWNSMTTAKVTTNGKPNDEGTDKGYLVEMSVPWQAFGVSGPPAVGGDKPAIWRMNFFVMDIRKDGQRAVSWSPPMVADFHTLGRFGQVEFINASSVPQEGPAAPKSSTSDSEKEPKAATGPSSAASPATAAKTPEKQPPAKQLKGAAKKKAP